MSNDQAHLIGDVVLHGHAGVAQLARARRRGVGLALLLTVWVVGLGCFPIFTPEVTRNSEQLSGSLQSEVTDDQYDHTERLYITGVEERQGLRRYRLALTGLLTKREQLSVIEFSHDEVTGQVAIIREAGTATPAHPSIQEVRIFRRSNLTWKEETPHESQQVAALLTNEGGVPTSVFMEQKYFGEAHVELQFRYRDQFNIIRRANLAVIPRALNQSPGLSVLNRLNYVWSVPADTVVVVVGWAIFWPLGVSFTSGGGLHVGP